MAANISYSRATFRNIYVWTAPDGAFRRYWACFSNSGGVEVNVELSQADAERFSAAMFDAVMATKKLPPVPASPVRFDGRKVIQPPPQPVVDTSSSQLPAEEQFAALFRPVLGQPAEPTSGDRANDFLNAPAGKPRDARFNDLYCTLCGERQWVDAAGGVNCKNEHKGVKGRRQLARKQLTVDLDPVKTRNEGYARKGMGPDGQLLL